MKLSRSNEGILVIGGDLSGLAVVNYIASSGLKVRVLERSKRLGGRAATSRKRGFSFNLGPHGLYCSGAGIKVLKELGIRVKGGIAKTLGGYAVEGQKLYSLPEQLLSCFSGPQAQQEAVRFFKKLPKIKTNPLQSLSVREWLDGLIEHQDVRGFVNALLRLATYAQDLERQSAGAALAQLQLAIKGNVLYLDQGWQSLVEALRKKALKLGAQIHVDSEVEWIERAGKDYRVHLKNGKLYQAEILVLAAPASITKRLLENLGEIALSKFINEGVPVKAAGLDMALSRLPQKNVIYAFGIDKPLYFSVHSASARLAPRGGALIHVSKFLDPRETQNEAENEKEMEGFLDLLQPGWRKRILEKRFTPDFTVSNAMVRADQGGTPGRPSPQVEECENLYVVGDWVGPEGMLSDATLSSAKLASEMIVKSKSTYK